MPSQAEPNRTYEFRSFRLDPAERLLLRDGTVVPLTPKAFDLLVYLVEHRGRLVEKHSLMSALWPHTVVEEANLTYNVSALRKALEDGRDDGKFIETVPTRGYRFVAPVTHRGDLPVASVPGTTARSVQPLVRRVATIALAFAGVAVLLGLLRHVRQTADPDVPALARFTIPLPDPTPAASMPMSQISPDGRRVALIPEMGSRIWLRNIDGQAALPIAGTEGAMTLFWAPDSQQLAFSTSSELKKLRVSEGTVQTLCGDACQPTGGGTWSITGLIVFTTLNGSLLGIPADGGQPRAMSRLDRSRGEISHLSPSFLPDGVRFLYVSRNADPTRSGLYVEQVGSGKPRLLLEGDVPAVYATPGYLLFLRSGLLMAQRLDASDLTFRGEASPLVPVSRNSLVGQPTFSASHTGVLTYSIVERPVTQFQWVGRAGELQQVVGEPGRYYTFDLSSDASRLVFTQVEAGYGSLRVLDLRSNIATRLTFGTSFYADPRWMADGQRLVATKWQPLPQGPVQISPDGLESRIPISGDGNMVDDVSPDGQYLLYRQGRQLLARSFSEGSTPILVGSAPAGGINQSQFSPDGRWIAYHSDESGRSEVYITPFLPIGERSQVSVGGGLQPVWRQDGRELYYLGLDGTLNVAELRASHCPLISRRRLFQTGLVPIANVEQYAASRDGQRFLLLKVVEDKVRSSIGVVLNWPTLLQAGRAH